MNTRVAPQGYAVISNILTENDIQQLTQYFNLLETHNYLDHTQSMKNAVGKYADIVSESLLLHIQPEIEKALNVELLPTYSYIRKYDYGSSLKKHTDRPSSEYICSVNINYAPIEPTWPIYVEIDKEDIQINLKKGEGVVYQGANMPHWRFPFDGQFSMHAFLSYVDANGEHTNYKNDNRKQFFGQKDFRAVLKSRVYSLSNIKNLGIDTPIAVTIPTAYSVEQNGLFSTIVFHKIDKIKVPTSSVALIEEVLAQTKPFQLNKLKAQINDKFALTFIKKLIFLGYLKINE